MVTEYIGLAEKIKGGYTVFFPDFPGLGSSGNSLVDARKNAKEGLVGHIELLIEHRERLPKPSDLDSVMALKDAKGCIPLIIAIVVPAGKAQRINITMDEAVLDAIDVAAQAQHTTRSALLAKAAQQLLSIEQMKKIRKIKGVSNKELADWISTRK